MFTKIYDIAYEIDGDQLNLEQESGCGETSLLTLHRLHLSHLAGLMGIVKAPTDGESQKTIATLTQRLNLLRDRIDFIADYLEDHSDSKHADLSFEQTYARATADIADEYCAEMEDAVTPSNAACNVTASRLDGSHNKPA